MRSAALNCHRIKTIEQNRGWRSTQPAQQPAKSYQMVRAYLLEHPCADCGYADMRALEFDHVSGLKFDEISHMLSQGNSWLRIQAEIAKCEVRCANCHRIKTMERLMALLSEKHMSSAWLFQWRV